VAVLLAVLATNIDATTCNYKLVTGTRQMNHEICARSRKGCKQGGIGTRVDERDMCGTGIPRDGASATLTAEATYSEVIQMPQICAVATRRCRTRFCSRLRLFPDDSAPITPVLSDFTRKRVLVYPQAIAVSRPSSMATISAQPMSRPSLFQPGLSFTVLGFGISRRPRALAAGQFSSTTGKSRQKDYLIKSK
jgi:hypothetical protein